MFLDFPIFENVLFQDDTSGDYCDILLALTGDRPAPEISAEELAEANEPQEIEEVEEEVVPVNITLCYIFSQPPYVIWLSRRFDSAD